MPARPNPSPSLIGALLRALTLGVALLVAAPATATSTAPSAAPGDNGTRAPVPRCDGEVATIVGTSGKDRIMGTPRADVIVGLGERDVIDGRGGDDRICGGGEKDRLAGGAGDDRVLGQRDGCFGLCSPVTGGLIPVGDVLSGGPGDDVLIGGDPRDPDDLVFANAVRGVRVDLARGVSTGQGRDRLRGIGNVETTQFDDAVRGLVGQGRAYLGGGGDVVPGTGERWTGFVSGGSGNDVMTVSGGGSVVQLGPGDDRATGSRRTTLLGAEGDDRLRLTGPLGSYAGDGPGDDVVIGSAGNDQFNLGSGNDRLEAGGGDDVVNDGGGNATIEAGPGDDRVAAGRGDDTYRGGRGTDLVTYQEIDGDVGVRLDLAAGTATGLGGDDDIGGFEDATGSFRDDEILGDDGDNRLVPGSSGTDVVRGRGGADTIVVRFNLGAVHGDAGDDVLELTRPYGEIDGLSLDGGADRDLFAFTGFASRLSIDLAIGTITGEGTASLVGVEDVTDNDGDHTLIGDEGPNVLRGGGGDDDLRGNGGDDQLFGDDGDDSADGGDGTDTCEAETATTCEG